MNKNYLAASSNKWVSVAREEWLQGFVMLIAGELGLDDIEGPHKTGPDFYASYNGFRFPVEVESRLCNYGQHKHHLDKRWDKAILITFADQLTDPAYTKSYTDTYNISQVWGIDGVEFSEWLNGIQSDLYLLSKRHNLPPSVAELLLSVRPITKITDVPLWYRQRFGVKRSEL